MKAIKVNNPLYVGRLGPYIAEFVKKVDIKGITYETLYAHLAKEAQFGGDRSEVWVVLEDDDKPIALGKWNVLDLPYVGTARLAIVHSWINNNEAVNLLIDEFLKFKDKHNCVYVEGCFYTPSRMKLFKKYAEKLGIEIQDTGIINFVGWRK